jgi:nitrogen regulatory protein PII
MKRIEVVIAPWALDIFKEAAPGLGITEFDLVEVYRSGCTTIERQKRLYRGREFTADLLPCLKLEFVLLDDEVQTTLHQLLELVNPETIAIFRVDQTLRPAKGHLTSVPPRDRTTNRPTQAETRQIAGFVRRRSDEDCDQSSDVPLKNTADAKSDIRRNAS